MNSEIAIHNTGLICNLMRRELQERGHVNVCFVMETLDGRLLTDKEKKTEQTTILLNQGHFKSVTCTSTLRGIEIKATLSKVADSDMYQVTHDSGQSSFAASETWDIHDAAPILRLAVVNHSESIKNS